MWNDEVKDDSREIVLSRGQDYQAAIDRILADAGTDAPEPRFMPVAAFGAVVAEIDAELVELITGKRKKDVEQEEEFDDEEEEDELDEEEDEDDFDDEEDEDEFEEEFGDDELDDDDDDIFYDDDDE